MTAHSWVEISKSALLHNISMYKHLLPPHTLLAPVIKSNAYGHGIIEIASILNSCPHIGYLCVVSLSEALLLRAHGVTKPLLVLSIIDADLTQAITHNIDLVAYDYELVVRLNRLAQTLHKTAALHLKIDTGLSRLGIHHEEALTSIREYATFPHVELRGIFSHFAASERSDLSFSHLQLKRLNNIVASLEQEGIVIPFKHFACSAAITSLPESHYNFARLGIGTYGLWSSVESKVRVETLHPHVNLHPVMEWKTRVIARKSLPAGSFIGYDCTYQTPTDAQTVTLPVGYYDGYDRQLSNQGMVKIRDRFFPIRGRIAMNLSIVDVSTYPDIQVGDEVTLLGADHLLSAEMLAEQCSTINYEIVARINPLIPRIIVP